MAGRLSSRLLGAPAALAFVAALVLGGCAGTSTTGVPAPVESMEHVHGMGLNPADGKLYVATHHGLFRLEPKVGAGQGGEVPHEPVPVGDTKWDFMGFTVVGPDHFLASGHPDVQGMRAGEPTRLGLVESRDAGRTWQRLSLGGQADFHALRVVAGRVYGYDSSSGRLMVSEDGKAWEELSRPAVFDFAVDEARPERVVATTNAGLVVSSDRGRTWSEPRPPVLAYLSWSEGAFWGVSPDGVLYRESGDGGWREAGKAPGPAVAFLALPGALYLATPEASVLVSTDGGASWTPVYSSGQADRP